MKKIEQNNSLSAFPLIEFQNDWQVKKETKGRRLIVRQNIVWHFFFSASFCFAPNQAIYINTRPTKMSKTNKQMNPHTKMPTTNLII